MKKFVIAAAMGVALVANAAGADEVFTKSHERMLVKLCEAVQSNSKIRLHTTLKHYKVTHRDIQEGLVCNGHDPITFAMLSGAENNAQMIARRTKLDVDTVLASN